jgi:Fe-S cluster biogenesis protein NfuA
MERLELYTRVQQALDTIRPYMEADGGNVRLIEVTAEKIVRLELLGSCSTCRMSHMTLKAGVEQAIIHAVPEIRGIEAVSAESLAL